MKRHYLKLCKKTWPYTFPAIVLCAYIFSVPAEHRELVSPAYDFNKIRQLKTDAVIPAFEDITLEVGIDVIHAQRSETLDGLNNSIGSGACLFDFDNDGFIDILTLNGGGTKHFFGKPQWWQSNFNSLSLYRNNNGSSFSQVTNSSGLIAVTETMGCNAGDLDNDGDTDVLLTNKGGNQLWSNNGDGTFSDISTSSGIAGESWSTSSVFGDVNQDGLTDIYITNYIDFVPNARVFEENAGYDQEAQKRFVARLYPGQANKLYINQGEMIFQEVAQSFGVANSQGRGLSASLVDINNDKWPDLMVANDHDSENKIYLNVKGQRFKDISTQSKLAIATGTPAILKLSQSNSKQSLLLTSKSGDHPRMFELNDTNNHWEADDISDSQLLHEQGLSKTFWGAVSTDVNGDGLRDLVFANGSDRPHSDAPQVSAGQPNTLVISTQEDRYIDVSQRLNPSTNSSMSSRCVSSADFNNDGAPDLFFTQNNDLPQLLVNKLSIESWIGFDLLHSGARTLQGAKIEVESGELKQTLYFGQNQGFLCSGDQRLLFGLGKNNSSIKAKVTWPDGKIQNIADFKLNRYNRVDRNGVLSPDIANRTPPKAVTRSSIRVSLDNHKLRVIGWLLENKWFDLATKELGIFVGDSGSSKREKAFQMATGLPDFQGRAFIQKALSDKSEFIRRQALTHVKKNEDERFMRWLLYALSDPEPKVSCQAASVFEYFYSEEEAATIRKNLSLNPLIELASGDNPEAQICAIRALGEAEEYRSLEVLRDKLLHNESASVRAEAAYALGRIKEKVALETLVKAFETRTESPIVRAAAISSVFAIDRHFDIKTLIEKTHNGSPALHDVTNNLQTWLLVSAKEDNRVHIPESVYLPLVTRWRNVHFKELTPNDHLIYFEILGQSRKNFSAADMSYIRKLRISESPEIRSAALRILLTFGPNSERAKHLVSALNDSAISKFALSNLSNVKLDTKEFYQLSKTLPSQIRLTAIWLLNAEKESKDLQQLVIETLNHDEVGVTLKVLVINRLKKHLSLLPNLCNHPALADSGVNGAVLEYLNGCLIEKSIQKTMPAPLQVALNQKATSKQYNISSYEAALRALASRKEPWAITAINRALTNDILELSSIEVLLKALTEKPSKSLRENLIKIHNRNPKSPIAALIIKYHLKSKPKFTKQALISLEDHLENGDEDTAMLFADALIATIPDSVLRTLLGQHQ